MLKWYLSLSLLTSSHSNSFSLILQILIMFLIVFYNLRCSSCRVNELLFLLMASTCDIVSNSPKPRRLVMSKGLSLMFYKHIWNYANMLESHRFSWHSWSVNFWTSFKNAMNTSCPSFIMLLYIKIHSFELIMPDFFIQMHYVADNLQAVQYVHLGYGRSCYVIHLLNDIFSTQHLPRINDLKSFCKNNYWISPNLNLSSFCFVNCIHVMPRSTTLILTYFSLSFRYTALCWKMTGIPLLMN